jgi:sortase A
MPSEAPDPGPSFLPGPATADPASLPALLRLSLRRPGAQRSASGLIAVLCLAAVSMFAFPGVTDLVGRTNQRQVAAQLADPHFKSAYRHGRVEIGHGLTRLVIDNSRVKVDVVVVQGTTVAALRAGAGHYVGTPFPCGAAGNVAIAGHRTTYGRPFNRINDLRAGDAVSLITPVSRCVYRVMSATVAGYSSNPFVVAPTDVQVVAQAGSPQPPAVGQWLTLTSCNPPGSAAQRIVVRLVMTSCHGSTCHQQKGTT